MVTKPFTATLDPAQWHIWEGLEKPETDTWSSILEGDTNHIVIVLIGLCGWRKFSKGKSQSVVPSDLKGTIKTNSFPTGVKRFE